MFQPKFRAWHPVGYFIRQGDSLVDFFAEVEATQGAVVSQFTNSLDKNGKEIFSGDIVKVSYPDDWCYEKGDTQKHPRAGQCVAISEVKAAEDGMLRFYVVPNDPWYVYEIIGNVFQNAELIKYNLTL